MVKYVGAISGVVNTTDLLDGTISVDDATTALATKSQVFDIENLAANGDIAERTLWVSPAGITITSVSVLNQENTAAGINDANTLVYTIRNGLGGSTIVAETFDTTTTWPIANVEQSLGTLANTTVAAGTVITMQITQGANADAPAHWLVVEYE